MKGMAAVLLALAALATWAFPAAGGVAVKKFDYRHDAPGGEARGFSSLVGIWHVERDGGRNVYAVDGRKWEQGLMAPGAKEKGKSLFGERSAEFLDSLEAYRYFPLAVCKEVRSFRSGTIEVSFKTVSGRIDQAAGIAFNIRPNGEYLVLRANALESNIVLFSMERGRRSSVQWVRNVPVPANQWQTLKLVTNGRTVEGYLNNRKYLEYAWKEEIDGRVGLWSKADSYVFFGDFTVEGR